MPSPRQSNATASPPPRQPRSRNSLHNVASTAPQTMTPAELEQFVGYYYQQNPLFPQRPQPSYNNNRSPPSLSQRASRLADNVPATASYIDAHNTRVLHSSLSLTTVSTRTRTPGTTSPDADPDAWDLEANLYKDSNGNITTYPAAAASDDDHDQEASDDDEDDDDDYDNKYNDKAKGEYDDDDSAGQGSSDEPSRSIQMIDMSQKTPSPTAPPAGPDAPLAGPPRGPPEPPERSRGKIAVIMLALGVRCPSMFIMQMKKILTPPPVGRLPCRSRHCKSQNMKIAPLQTTHEHPH